MARKTPSASCLSVVGKGVRIQCEFDTNDPTGIKTTNEELRMVNIEHSDFHGERTYVIRPRM